VLSQEIIKCVSLQEMSCEHVYVQQHWPVANNVMPRLRSLGGRENRLCGLVITVPGYRSRGPGFDSWRYQIFWEVVGLEQDPLSLVRITEELLQWKSSDSGSRKSRLTVVGIRCAHNATPLSAKVALTSMTSGGRSDGIVRLRTKATEFSFLVKSGKNLRTEITGLLKSWKAVQNNAPCSQLLESTWREESHRLKELAMPEKVGAR
jgi:hypothetical protein